MSTKRITTLRRPAAVRKNRSSPRPVQELLLELTYRLHATRPVAVVRERSHASVA
ncbi:MAG TPA: hypothetical protein VHR66_32145 [Gemmataceae bacterium]|jgi:chorismate mutase|nr:hypothetical protein [Gemmataceae bacterium]